MKRLPRLRAAFGLVVLLAACGRPFEARDVLLITVDTLRADALGVYGYEAARTPVLDRLAERGRWWESAFTPFPRTTPALASLMTGRRPEVHGSREVGQPARRDLPHLASELARRGWATLAVSANGTAGPSQGLEEGFDAFVSADELEKRGAEHVIAAAVDLLDRHRDAERVFLWVHFIEPHFPYTPRRVFLEPPGPGPCQELVRWAVESRHRTAHVVSDRDGRSSAAREDCRRLYDAEVAFVDQQIGELLSAWEEERGPVEESVVVATSDHGENLGEWELFYQHGPNVHDASVRIPLILAGPGVPPGTAIEPATLEDLLPTVLSLVGVPRAEHPAGEGRDLTRAFPGGWWAAGGDDERTLFAESGSALLLESFRYISSGRAAERSCTNGPRYALCQAPGGPFELFDHRVDPDLTLDLIEQRPDEARAMMALRERWPPERPRQRSIRRGRFLLVQVPTYQGGFRMALYDTQADPGLQRDLKAEHPQEAEALRRALEAWAESLPKPESLGELSPEETEQLRALGYID